MAKKQIKLDENSLKNLIRESVIKYLKENVDEISPEFLIHASHAADADRKKHVGRGKNSPDPAIRAKRDRQAKAFGAEAANRINQDLDSNDFMAVGDRGARTLYMAKGKDSAYLRPDSDFDSTKVYNDDFKDGDVTRTIADLDPEGYAEAEKMFNKFKGYHNRAAELDDKYLEETISRVVNNVIKESKFGNDNS